MHQPLNIPLCTPATTRRDTRRVVAIVSGIIVGACIGLLAFRAPFVISKTAVMIPADAATVRILKTDHTVDLLNAHLGNRQIVPGAPWTLETLLRHTQRELSVSLLTSGEVVYSIDAVLPEEMRNTAKAFGMHIDVQDGITRISPIKIDNTTGGQHFVLRGLLPWHQGEIIDDERRGSLRITARGITFRGLGIATETPRARLPNDMKVLAHFTATTKTSGFPSNLMSMLSSPMGEMISILQENGGTLAITGDEQGESFILTTSPGNLQSEELASMGKDIMNRTVLSTQDWTIYDGSTYQEIVAASADVTVDVRAEEGFTFVSLRNSAEGLIRMTKTADILTISNREIDITRGEKAKSSCLRSAHTWLTEDLFTEPAIKSFTEIAVNGGNVRLCW